MTNHGDGRYEPFEPTAEQLAECAAWLAKRPAAVRAVAERLLPWKVWRLKPTGQHARALSFSEGPDGLVTVTAIVWRPEVPGLFDRTVFGLAPEDFEEIG